jgi:nucleoside-diphosphate-sugar epimerase
MRVLVTGATGFVGRHLCEAFLEAGHQGVALVRRESEELERLGIKMVTAHLEEKESLKKILEDAGEVETAIHNAGLIRAKSLVHYWEVNAIGTFNLLEAMEESGRKPKLLVYISSLAAAGPGRLVKEEERPHPITPYGASKLYGEIFVKKGEIPHLVLRPPVIYGPRDKALLGFFRLVKLGVVPNWERFYSLCFVKDLARVCVAAAERGLSNETLFVAQGEFTFSELCRAAGRLMGKNPKAVPLPQVLVSAIGAVGGLGRCLFGTAPMLSPEKAREMRQPAWSCSTERYQALGLPEPVSMEVGFAETIRWYQQIGLL